MQLAEMRLKSDQSAANQQLFDQAKGVYENAKNPESQKNDQVSGDSLSMADLVHQAQESFDRQLASAKDLAKTTKPAAKPKAVPTAPVPPVADQNTDQSNEDSEQEEESEGTSEEKKTEAAL